MEEENYRYLKFSLSKKSLFEKILCIIDFQYQNYFLKSDNGVYADNHM